MPLLAAVVLWIVMTLCVGPARAGIDVFIFKDAGVNWALGRGFVSAMVPGQLSFMPKLYASYPPLFPLFFGVYTKIFGLGPMQGTLFNLMLSGACVFLFFVLVRSDGRRLLWPLAFMIPTGALTIETDRPEMLAFALLLSLLIAGEMTPGRKAWPLFFGAGVNVLVSPFAGLATFGVLCIAYGRRLATPRAWVQSAAAVALPLIAVCGAMWLQDPEVWERFRAHGVGGGNGLGVLIGIFHGGGLTAYVDSLKYSTFAARWESAAGILSVLAVFGLLLPAYGGLGRRALIGAALLAAFPFLAFPSQPNYMLFMRSALLALFATLAPRRTRVLSTCLWIIALTQLPFVARDFAVRWAAGPSLAGARSRVQALSAGSPGLAALITPDLYFLWKPYLEVYDVTRFPVGHEPGPARFAAFSYFGSGNPDRANIPAWVSTLNWRKFWAPLSQMPLMVAGIPLSRSAATWESEIFLLPHLKANQ